ncbi:MAG TPA: YbjQ family protein [Bryobacteraceae bacterium]
MAILRASGQITTAFELDGFRITKNLGVVRGITVRSRSALGSFAGAVQTFVGGNITIYTELCEKVRTEAFELMLQHAAALGANAVIGMRYDANEVTDGVTEVVTRTGNSIRNCPECDE